MASRRKSAKTLADRTPIAEWAAAALGLVLTLALVGYTAWEGLTEDPGPPRLSVVQEPAHASAAGFVVPIVVKNASHATAADVVVRGRQYAADGSAEDRQATFAYVAGRGETRGALVFEADPKTAKVQVSVEGFAEP